MSTSVVTAPEFPVIEAPHSGSAALRWGGRVALGLAGSFLVDQEIGRHVWARCKPEITEYPAEPGAPSDTAILACVGFNSRSKAIEPLLPAFARRGRTAILHDSPAGLNFGDNFAAIAEWATGTNTKNVVMYGPSQGIMPHLIVAPKLKHELGLNLFLFMDGSPSGFPDIQGAARRATLRGLAKAGKLGVSGGLGTRFALEALGYSIDNAGRMHQPFEGITHAYKKAREAGGLHSNKQLLDRARLLRYFDPAPLLAELPDVPIAYAGPDDPARDPVVNQVTALATFQTLVSEEINHVTGPNIGHANPASFPAEYLVIADRILDGFELPAAA